MFVLLFGRGWFSDRWRCVGSSLTFPGWRNLGLSSAVGLASFFRVRHWGNCFWIVSGMALGSSRSTNFRKFVKFKLQICKGDGFLGIFLPNLLGRWTDSVSMRASNALLQPTVLTR